MVLKTTGRRESLETSVWLTPNLALAARAPRRDEPTGAPPRASPLLDVLFVLYRIGPCPAVQPAAATGHPYFSRHPQPGTSRRPRRLDLRGDLDDPTLHPIPLQTHRSTPGTWRATTLTRTVTRNARPRSGPNAPPSLPARGRTPGLCPLTRRSPAALTRAALTTGSPESMRAP